MLPRFCVVAATYRAAAAAVVGPAEVAELVFGLRQALCAAMSAAKKAIMVFFFSVASFSSRTHSNWPEPGVAKDLLFLTPITMPRSSEGKTDLFLNLHWGLLKNRQLAS